MYTNTHVFLNKSLALTYFNNQFTCDLGDFTGKSLENNWSKIKEICTQITYAYDQTILSLFYSVSHNSRLIKSPDDSRLLDI